MVRYKRLGYVALNVKDLDVSETFYRDVVGLDAARSAERDLVYLRCSEKHHDIVLYQAPEHGLKRIGFELESEDEIANVKAMLDKNGTPWTGIPASDVAAMHVSGGVRCHEPITGCALDFYVSMEEMTQRYEVKAMAKIQRLGHIVIKSADQTETARFFADVLNFKVSDTIDGLIAFMRCFPNPYHHSLGVGNGRGTNGLHHVNFMCTDADDIGQSYWRLKKANVPIVYGPGRHPPSGSMFLYYLDPDGMTVEYSFGMEEFPEHDAREPRLLPPVQESFDYWCSYQDKEKYAKGPIEQSK